MQKDLLADFLRLYHAISPARRRCAALLEYFDGDPRTALDSSPAKLRALGLDRATIGRIHRRRLPAVQADLRWAEQAGHHLIWIGDETYPPLLRQIPDPPLLLYAIGDRHLVDVLLLHHLGRLSQCHRQPSGHRSRPSR